MKTYKATPFKAAWKPWLPWTFQAKAERAKQSSKPSGSVRAQCQGFDKDPATFDHYSTHA